MTKRAAGKYARRARDKYDTVDPRPVEKLLPFLPRRVKFCEPTAGAGDLIRHLESAGHECVAAYDIAPRARGIAALDALTLTRDHLNGAEVIVGNVPWEEKLLHAMIDRFRQIVPSWLLHHADWSNNIRAAALGAYCSDIVPVGRVSWLGNGKGGMDNCAWYRFGAARTHTEFHWRDPA